MYSSIIKKSCKCGCGSPPSIGFEGYNSACRPDLKEEKIKKHNAKQNQISKVRKLGREQRSDIGVLEMEVQAMKAELDFAFSRIVRISAANNLGYISCYTCDKNVHWSLAQNSHFVKRGNTLLRWDRRNCHAACKHCNEDLEGNLIEYAKRLNQEQSGLAEQLIEEGKEVHKWHRDELKQMLIDFRSKLNLLELKFKK